MALALASTSCRKTPEPNHFESADTDRDGALDVPELEAALVAAIHAAGDTNKDGEMTYAELEKVYASANRAKFGAADGDRSGTLSLKEVKNAMDKDNAFDKLMSKIDTNGDGIIDKVEAGRFHDAMEAADGASDLDKLKTILDS